MALSALGCMGYFLAFGQRGRPFYFAAAVVVFLLAFISPFSALANGYLFQRAHGSAHLARADRSRTAVAKSTTVLLASFFPHLS